MLGLRTALFRNFAKKKVKRAKVVKIPDPEYTPSFAMNMIRMHNFAFSDPTIDFIIHLNINPRRGDQTIRGTCVLPSGSGKSEKICFFCTDEANQKLARSLGIEIIGDQKTLDEIKNDEINFDKCYATKAGVALLKPYARILGPKNLFPNTKVNTLINQENLKEVLTEAKQGKLDFRTDVHAHIRVPIGKMSFSDDALFQNIDNFMASVADKRPQTVQGQLYKKIMIKSSLGPAYK